MASRAELAKQRIANLTRGAESRQQIEEAAVAAGNPPERQGGRVVKVKCSDGAERLAIERPDGTHDLLCSGEVLQGVKVKGTVVPPDPELDGDDAPVELDDDDSD
jgi:hypothetical protein